MIRLSTALRAPCAAALVAIAAACGTTGNNAPVYTASEEVPPVRTPAGLSTPDFDSGYEIPGYSLPELAAQGNEVKPPQVLSSAEAEQARSRIRFGPTGLYLEVDDSAASTWRRLGFALDRGELEIQQVLGDERRFRVRFSHEPIRVTERGLFGKLFLFWRSPEYLDYSGTYLFEVQRQSSETTRVAILDDDGDILPMERAEFVLSRIRERLG
jgi:uncharacterized lipoprotein